MSLKERLLELWFRSFLLWLRLLLSLRYRIRIEGWERLAQMPLRPGRGILFLPNHPAEIDPVMLTSFLWPYYRLRPLVIDYFFYPKLFRFFMNRVRALPVPMVDAARNQWRQKQIRKLFTQVVDGLQQGDNFLIYPAGKLKMTGLEMLGGASLTHQLLQACPDINVVLIRTTGLWGSLFSRADTGQVPSFAKALFQGFRALLKSGFLFLPRRRVKIELFPAPADFPYKASRLELNKYLEAWYNRYPEEGSEPLNLVSYCIWKRQFHPIALADVRKRVTAKVNVSQKMEREVLEECARLSGAKIDAIQREMNLSMDLGLDSLDIAQLYVFLDEHFEICDLPPGELQTVEDVIAAAAGHKRRERTLRTPDKWEERWLKERDRPPAAPPIGKTLQEAFLRCTDRMGDAIACADATSGLFTYKKFKLVALVLAEKIRELEGDAIGVFLPSSSTAYLVIFAILLANKVPVMLNWTAGKRALDRAVELTGIRAVISSYQFLDRIENGEFGEVEERFVFLEILKEEIRWLQKARAFRLSRKKAKTLLKKLGLSALPSSDTAVILFTSGTETLPKGVPLSHANLLSNQRGGMTCAEFRSTDTFHSVLPPFHSFGFSVTGVFPILAGIRAFYAPDPNDSHGLAFDIEHRRLTIFCAAPSFVRALFRVTTAQAMRTLRLVIVGAERSGPEIFEYVETALPHAQVMEGYGITECAPIVTCTRPGTVRTGVGQPLPFVELLIVDPKTHEPKPCGEEGEVCISGPNVFNGYLGSTPSPFLLFRGKRWYCSADRGHIERDGSLVLSGRLKRFVKIGGEMVSLVSLEEEILAVARERRWLGEEQELPQVAVVARERDTDKTSLVLFATFAVAKEEINEVLRQRGFGRIAKIAEVRHMDEIPLTGTGKTHYRVLEDALNPDHAPT